MRSIWMSAVAALLLCASALAQSDDDRYVTTSLGRTLRTPEGIKVIRHVEPVPPKLALKRGTGGEVDVQALIDISGNVAEVKVMKGLPDGLNEASMEAVRQWKFEPYLDNGQPIPVLFTVHLNFRVSRSPAEAALSMISTSLGDTVHISDPKYAPKVLRHVNPLFPEAAKRAGTYGPVRMAVLIDKEGKVHDVKVLEGLPNGLTENAAYAVRQWRYKPFARDGQTWPVQTEVIILFKRP